MRKTKLDPDLVDISWYNKFWLEFFEFLRAPPGHKGVCIAQHCTMGVPLQRVFPSFQGGGILWAHHGLCICFSTTIPFTNQPFVLPHHSGAQEPCQPIDALPPQLRLHLCAQVSFGGACIVCWWHAALWQGWCHCKEPPPPLIQRRAHYPVMSHGSAMSIMYVGKTGNHILWWASCMLIQALTTNRLFYCFFAPHP
jgi:hypothetical protein